MKELDVYDSYTEPDETRLFYVGTIAGFVSPNHQGSVTKLHAEEGVVEEDDEVEGRGNCFEISAIGHCEGAPGHEGPTTEFEHLKIVHDATRKRLHLQLGPMTTVENIVLVRARNNGGLDNELFFVEEFQGSAAYRVWKLLDADHAETNRLLDENRLLHGTILRHDDGEEIIFQDVAGGSDAENARYFELQKELLPANQA